MKMRGKVLFVFLLQSLFLTTVSPEPSSEEDSSSEIHHEEQRKSGSHGHWKYDDQDTWSLDFKNCSGKSQSPINIDTRAAIFTPALPPIVLQGYDLSDEEKLTLQNNGHTLQLSLPDTMRIVRGFDNVFVAAQLHFHWGTVKVPGSEHTVDGLHFPAEIHVVHYNTKYDSLSEAASKTDGLAVLGAFIEIGPQENANYDNILSSLTDVSIEESDTEIPGFNVRFLLPPNLDHFYRYNGSLTTPPCFQTVNWTIFNETVKVSRKQLSELEDTLKAGHDTVLSKNFRASQLLYGRRVLSSFEALSSPGGVSSGGTEDTSSGKSSKRGARLGSGEDSSEKDLTDKDEEDAKFALGLGEILAIVFGVLFIVTLLSFMMYMVQQRKKNSRLRKDTRQNVIYTPASKEGV
ncbi:carbonic anhydrase 9-like isoform X1 [Acipenser ruthenus]|uniref:carbonic anhydrase 9-like isoform X1 n=1 Tax=Acipenser ruthenus TaxID=7906 RepID=UPI00145BB480|nr:carbonic anhydrase 9-like isoform X1 [Acipenser ruthenus]